MLTKKREGANLKITKLCGIVAVAKTFLQKLSRRRKGMKKNFQNKKLIWKQIVSLFLVIAMVLSMAPVSSFNVQAEETSQVSEEQVTVKLHFKNSSNWENVYLYSWVKANGSDTYPTKAWPGTKIANQDSAGYYSYEVTTSASYAFNFIFNNNNGSQTADLSISAATLAGDEDGVVEVWADASSNLSYEAPVVSPEVNGTTVTFRYKNASASSVCVAGSMNGWSTTANPMTKDDNGVWTLTMELAAGTYEYKFVVDGGWYTDPQNDSYANGNSVVAVYESPVVSEGSVTFKYANDYATKVEVFGSMNSWTSGYTMTKGSDGLWTYTLTGVESGVIQYKFVVTYEDGTQVWIADPANKKTAGSDGNSVAYVPGLLGANVSGKKGSTITLPASLNYLESDGTTTKKAVTYSGVEGVTVNGTTVTVPEDYEGTKFDLIATTSDNLTATVTVGLYKNNEITVKIHYSRADGNYTNWNVWAWTDSGSAAYDFALEDGEQVASIVLEDGLNINALNFIVREGEWNSQEGGGRSIDLSSVVSGTVHCYVVSGSTAQSDLTYDYSEAIQGTKLNAIEYNRDTNTIIITASQEVVDADNAFAVTHLDGTAIEVKSVSESGTVYTLEIGEDLTGLQAVCKTYKLIYDGNSYIITMPNVYSTEEFEAEYTYDGDDLGSIWSEESTTFKVWAPTADSVSVYLYEDGTVMEDDADYVDAANPGNTEDDKPYQIVAMTKGDKGVWSATVTGDLNGKYYTYVTYVNGETEESCDPYARTTGANGERAMVIDLDSTDPEGWNEDDGPDNGMDYTDAVIYELHVRDFSIDDSSGVSEEYQGKFLAFTEEGTTVNGEGEISTGLDYLVNLGVTHIHLLPSYDYASIDETMTEEEKAQNLDKQFNWGYDPKNYNVPEGSYSTDPQNGEVRVNEMKQMVQSLHDNNINVIMDVVYNHVYDAATFCINEIVPGYFSRPDSNTSGCGNDTASERNMVRKYIVDSVVYWAKEYHIDGFRFDLVGLLDTVTINQIVEEVHAIDPDIIFYGEGWDMDSTNTTKSVSMARQGNAYLTPEFAYFSDSMRDLVRGGNSDEAALGFATGLTGKEEDMANNFKANIWWTSTPTQVVQYASCHDNYTLMDKINVSRSNASEADRIKMNNLTAAIYLTAEGIPLIHAGEEMLRTKVNSEGTVIHNSYKSPDYINSIKWDNLESEAVQDVSEYYQGLIEFRKNHAGLRLTTSTEVSNYVSYTWLTNEVIMMQISGNATDEVSDGIVIIFNATSSNKSFNLYDKGVATGDWQVCINAEKAGIDVIETISDGNVTVDALSALVLVKGETEDTDSVYVQNMKTEEEDLTDAALSVSKATLQLENDISIVFKAAASVVDNSYENCYVKVVQELENGETETQTIDGVLSSDRQNYEFKYTGVDAKEVGDLIDITIYAYNADGKLVTGETKEDYSVMAYCTSWLSKTDEQLTASGLSDDKIATFRTLLVDLVNYAAAAQEYFGYKTDALVNAQLTDEQKAYASDDSVLDALENITNTAYVKSENPTVTWKGAGLNLLSKTTVRVKFAYAGDISDISVAVKVDGKEATELTEFTSAGTGMYYVYFDEMTAYQFGEPLDFTVMKDGEAISNTLRYSVESYVAKNKDNATVGAVVSAMMKYGKAAMAYDTAE